MVNIGDLVPKSGIFTEPGVVVEKRLDGTVMVDTEPMTINKYHRYTNTSGLTEEEKTKFNSILDDIYQKNDDIEKINEIQHAIDELRINPVNHNIIRYLRNQQSYLIRAAKGLPRHYLTEENDLKK